MIFIKILFKIVSKSSEHLYGILYFLFFPTDKEIMTSEAQTAKDLADGEDKHNRLPVVSEGNSSEDSQFLGKRKRRQTGKWWVSSPHSPEEAKVTDNQPTLKRSKQNNTQPSAAVPSPVQTKKNKVLKRRNKTQPEPSSSRNTHKAKEKKTKRNNNKNTRGDTPHEMKATDKIFNAIEAEQIEEEEQQQEVPDQDLDPVQSSPLVLAHRDHSLNSSKTLLRRKYSDPLVKEKNQYHYLKILHYQ